MLFDQKSSTITAKRTRPMKKHKNHSEEVLENENQLEIGPFKCKDFSRKSEATNNWICLINSQSK